MYLIPATNNFKILNNSYPEFPLILNSEMEIESVVHQFLIYYCIKRGRVNSTHTWRSYGQSMYDYFGFLEANKLSWKNFLYNSDHSTIAAYRDYSLQNLNLQPNTINSRLRIIIKFYEYAYNKKWIDSLPFDIEDVIVFKPKGFLTHTDRSRNTRRSPDVMLKETKKIIKILSRDEIESLLNKTIFTSQNLIYRLALQSGLRKEELITLPKDYITNAKNMNKYKSHVRVTLDPKDMEIKGNKERCIDVPRGLFDKLKQYIIHERFQLENKSGRCQKELFLNQYGDPYSVKSSRLSEFIKKHIERDKIGLHTLRHTYATLTLYELRKKNLASEPLIYVRDRLGHNSVVTTEKYLHMLDHLEDDLMTAYQEEIDKI